MPPSAVPARGPGGDRASASIWLAATALGVYAAAGLAWTSLPGVSQDEVLFLNATFPQNPASRWAAQVSILGHNVPIMLMPYLGALKGWLWRAVFHLWTPSVYSVRVPTVVLGGLALLLFYVWARRFYSGWTAAVALALAATDPTYIFTARLDWGPVVLAHLLGFAGLWLGACWLGDRHEVRDDGRGRLAFLSGAGLSFGLGLWDKATFLWFLVALAAALLILFPREVARRLRAAPAAVLLISLLLGALPLVISNVQDRGSHTWEVLRLEHPDRRVLEKRHALEATLGGRFGYDWTGGQAADKDLGLAVSDRPQLVLDVLARLAPSEGTWLGWALIAALLVAAAARGARRPILFPLLVSALMWFEMPLLQGAGTSAHHYALSYPFPHLAVVAAAIWLRSKAVEWETRRRQAQATASHAARGSALFAWPRRALGLAPALGKGARVRGPGLALAALLLTQIGWDARYLRAFRETGGQGSWSDAIYEIAAYLSAVRPGRVVNMDWGFTTPLLLLTRGRLEQEDFYAEADLGASAHRPDHVRALMSLLRRPHTLFLFHAEGFEQLPEVRRIFEAALDGAGLRGRVLRTFYQRTGDPVAELMVAEPGPPGAPPAPAEPVQLSLAPAEVAPGGQYTIRCPDLAGRQIDLKYVFNSRPPAVARSFCLLDSAGNATIRVPKPFPAGTVEVVAVRVAGTLAWRPAQARITVR